LAFAARQLECALSRGKSQFVPLSAFVSLRKISKVFAMFNYYADESYNNRVMCVAGWLAPDGLWDVIEPQWTERIEYERRMSIKKGFAPISRFHAADCSSLVNEFDRTKGWDEDRQIKFVKKLIGIIGRKRLVGVGFGVSLEGHEAFYKTLNAARNNMYRTCMVRCLELVGEQMSESWPSERVTVFHDHGKFNGAAQSAFTAIKRHASPYRDYFVTMAPRCWQDSIALQPADLIAYEMFKAIQSQIHAKGKLVEQNMRKSLRALMGRKVPLFVRYVGPEMFRTMSHYLGVLPNPKRKT